MNKFFVVIFLISLFCVDIVHAKEERICSDLNQCVEIVSKLTGKKYIYTEKLKGKAHLSENITLTKKNAGNYLSHILNQNGYTRLFFDKNTYSIISARDVRYNATNMVRASYKKAPNLPNNDDYHMMIYSFRLPLISEEITKNFRPFMSRYGRITNLKIINKIIVQDTAKNLKRFYEIIKEVDRKPTKKIVSKLQREFEFKRKLKLIQARTSKKKTSNKSNK